MIDTSNFWFAWASLSEEDLSQAMCAEAIQKVMAPICLHGNDNKHRAQ